MGNEEKLEVCGLEDYGRAATSATAAHECLFFRDDDELALAVGAFLAEGLELGNRVGCVAPAETQLRVAIRELDDTDRLIERGALVLWPFDSVYDADGSVDIETRLAAYAAATEQALADGYTGLRVAAMGAELLSDPSRWADHTRWENVADRFMVSNPLAAMCCYDLRILDPRLAADIAAAHPIDNGATTPFRIYAKSRARVLEGQVDYFSVRHLERLLELTDNDPLDGVLDLSRLQFADHHALKSLDEFRTKRVSEGHQIKFTNVQPAVGRMAGLLDIEL